eukprot:IDg19013t1
MASFTNTASLWKSTMFRWRGALALICVSPMFIVYHYHSDFSVSPRFAFACVAGDLASAQMLSSTVFWLLYHRLISASVAKPIAVINNALVRSVFIMGPTYKQSEMYCTVDLRVSIELTIWSIFDCSILILNVFYLPIADAEATDGGNIPAFIVIDKKIVVVRPLA